MSDKPVRVRFAPSPTGPLHPGGVRTALYNYLLARKSKGTMILRIEDTDQTRFVPGAEEFIIESLKWCGIEFDEGVHVGGDYGPYRQSDRKPIYKEYITKLIADGKAYYAFDTPEELEIMREGLKSSTVVAPQYNSITRVNMKNSLSLPQDEVQRRLDNNEPYAVRFKMPRNEEIKVKDSIRGWVVFNSSQLDDKILFKSDGMPTYHLANVVDDKLMKISHVIRGEEWLPSTPLHVMLYKAFGWEDSIPEFAHLPLLLKPDGDGKLSKRDGDRLGLPFYAINWVSPETKELTLGYREVGYFPEAYINFLAFLGWNPGDHREIFSMDELIQEFSLERVHKHGARYDFGKLNWFNSQYLKNTSDEVLASMLMPELKNKGFDYSMEYLQEVCRLMKERWVVVTDCWSTSMFFFEAPQTYEQVVVEKKWNNSSKAVISSILEEINIASEELNAQQFEDIFKASCDKNGVKSGQVIQAFRLAISGVGSGPAIFEMAQLLGKKEIAERLTHSLDFIKY